MPAELTALVRSAQQGDEYAFRMLYRELQPGLLRYLTVLVGPDAEDVASETWLQIARDLTTFAGGPGFRAWATRVARNRALDHLRHQRRRPTLPVPVEALAELPGAEDTAASADEGLGTDTAVALIATLPRTEAEAVLLRTVIGLDAESTARVLGKRPGAVRTAAHRGLRRLARVLAAQNGQDAAVQPAGAGPADGQVADVRSGEDVEAGQGWR
ncbi:RNA polymerase sigma factor [Plantactinospora sp. CA-294935]|uniref:RNA polymerase sigma factor n=1 Tax=Plantactinospora sp. CA-294935 TaxID=3240012 RepID=UPI003D94C059